MRKLGFCLCKNKDADQLFSNCAADQCLCFSFMDSSISLLNKINRQVYVGPGQKP